jgi:hypothetical protein
VTDTARRKHLDVLTRGNASGTPWIDLQLRNDELRANGRVTTNWAFLEFLILRETQNLAAYLKISVPQEAAHVAFAHRLEAWEQLSAKALAKLHEERGRAFACIRRVKELQDDRHQLTHRIVEFDPADRDRLVAYRRTDFRERKFGWRLSVSKIEKIARDIARLNYDVLSIHSDPLLHATHCSKNEVCEIGSIVSLITIVARLFRVRQPPGRFRGHRKRAA